MERLMLARRWWWGCAYVGANVIVFVLSSLAGDSALLWRMGIGWLLSMGYLVVVVRTRTRRGPWGSRFRSELEDPEFWRETRRLSGNRLGGSSGARSDLLDAARRDASDWLSGIGVTTLLAIVFLAVAFGVPASWAALAPVGCGLVVLTVWGLVRARVVMARLDRADRTSADQRQRSA